MNNSEPSIIVSYSNLNLPKPPQQLPNIPGQINPPFYSQQGMNPPGLPPASYMQGPPQSLPPNPTSYGLPQSGFPPPMFPQQGIPQIPLPGLNALSSPQTSSIPTPVNQLGRSIIPPQPTQSGNFALPIPPPNFIPAHFSNPSNPQPNPNHVPNPNIPNMPMSNLPMPGLISNQRSPADEVSISSSEASLSLKNRINAPSLPTGSHNIIGGPGLGVPNPQGILPNSMNMPPNFPPQIPTNLAGMSPMMPGAPTILQPTFPSPGMPNVFGMPPQNPSNTGPSILPSPPNLPPASQIPKVPNIPQSGLPMPGMQNAPVLPQNPPIPVPPNPAIPPQYNLPIPGKPFIPNLPPQTPAIPSPPNMPGAPQPIGLNPRPPAPPGGIPQLPLPGMPGLPAKPIVPPGSFNPPLPPTGLPMPNMSFPGFPQPAQVAQIVTEVIPCDFTPLELIQSTNSHQEVARKYQSCSIKIIANGIEVKAEPQNIQAIRTEIGDLIKKFTFDSNARWAYLENDGQYKLYDSGSTQIIEQAYRRYYPELISRGYSTYSLKVEIRNTNGTYQIEFAQIGGVHRQVRKQANDTIRAVKRQANGEDLNKDFIRTYRWLWKHEDGKFRPYEDDAIFLIEQSYIDFNRGQVGKSIALIQGSNGKTYKIDFSSSTQFNEVTNFNRPIKRENI